MSVMSDPCNMSNGVGAEWSDPKAFARNFGSQAAKLLYNATGATGQANIKRLLSDDITVTLRLNVGRQSAIVRFFNPNDGIARFAFNRAIELHAAAAGLGLLVEVLGSSPQHYFLLEHDNSDKTVNSKINDTTANEIAHKLGRWFGNFANVTPSQSTDENWYTYLRHHYVANKESLEPHRTFLESVSISQEVLTGINLRLGGFKYALDDGCIQRQMQSFALKPLGLDVMSAGLELSKIVPEQDNTIRAALVSGWVETYKGDAIAPENLLKLMAIFGALPPIKGFTLRQISQDRYLEAFNAQRALGVPKAKAVFLSPFNDIKIVPVSQKDVRDFKSHLIDVQMADAQWSRDSKSSTERQGSVLEPSANQTALCASCAGFCCSKGHKNRAYLTSEDMKVFRKKHPSLDFESAAEEYVKCMPQEHVKGGCLFQGAQGCNLSREMRSFTCNNYLCSFAKRVVERDDLLEDSEAPILLVARKNGEVRRTSLFEAGAITAIETPPKVHQEVPP